MCRNYNKYDWTTYFIKHTFSLLNKTHCQSYVMSQLAKSYVHNVFPWYSLWGPGKARSQRENLMYTNQITVHFKRSLTDNAFTLTVTEITIVYLNFQNAFKQSLIFWWALMQHEVLCYVYFITGMSVNISTIQNNIKSHFWWIELNIWSGSF